MSQPAVTQGHETLLYLTRAYALYDSQVSNEQSELLALLRGEPTFPIRNLTAHEQVPFEDVDESAVVELKKDLSVKRYFWVPKVELRYPHGRTHARPDTALWVSLGRSLPDLSVVFFSFAIAFKKAPRTKELIAVIQSHLRDDGSRDGLTIQSEGTTFTSCLNFIEGCRHRLGIRERAQSVTWITELRTGLAEELAAFENDDDVRHTYGLLSADEGCSYVPVSRAKELTARSWSSRRFLWVGAYGPGVVVYNDKPSEYGATITRFFDEWFAVSRQYFADSFEIAGLDHGILYSVEAATLLKLTAECFIRDIEDGLHLNNGTQSRSPRLSWRDLSRGNLQSMQLRAFQYLDHVRDIGIGELGKLDKFVADETGLTRTIKDVERYAELIDGQLVNVTAIRLNVIVVLLSVIATVAAVIALFHL